MNINKIIFVEQNQLYYCKKKYLLYICYMLYKIFAKQLIIINYEN